MAFVSVTRLRIRSRRFLLGFLFHALRANHQVRASAGFRGGALLTDRRWTFWTITVWDSDGDMRSYMTRGAHRVAMPKLSRWCDEASIVHWDQPEAIVPTWTEADHRMRRDGRPSSVQNPSALHDSMTFAAPRVTAGGRLVPRKRP